MQLRNDKKEKMNKKIENFYSKKMNSFERVEQQKEYKKLWD